MPLGRWQLVVIRRSWAIRRAALLRTTHGPWCGWRRAVAMTLTMSAELVKQHSIIELVPQLVGLDADCEHMCNEADTV